MSGAFDEESGIQWVSDHARVRFTARAGDRQENLYAVWHDAVPVDYPSARENTCARYHPLTDLILLARWGELVTCIDLNDRPADEQVHVRSQLEDS